MKIFGLIEGHGNFSQIPLKYLKLNLCQKLMIKLQTQSDISKSIIYTFKKMFQQLCEQYYDYILFSGATITFCLFQGEDLYVSNIGNNKVILGYKNLHYNNLWQAQQLSYDHNLLQQCQHTRIIKNKGKIFKDKTIYKKGINNLRVWGKRDGKVYGISTTRSFGDLSLSECGIIPIPDVNKISLKSNHKIIFIGQEHIFSFLSNDEIIEICSYYYQKNSKSICQATKTIKKKLLKIAPSDEWSEQDFGFILIFLD